MASDSANRPETTRISRAEGVARELEQEIVNGSVPPGGRIGTKDDLRRKFGVAVATVNEALRLLEARGVVHARPGPGGGVFVSSTASRVRLNHLVLGFRTSDVPFSDCLEVRNALEPLVCREASRHCKPRDARELRAIVAKMGEAVNDPRAFLSLNWQLHRRLAAMCSNAPLKTLYLTLLDFVEEGLQDVDADAFYDGQENFRAHDTLIEAIIDGDRWQLERAIERHWPMASRWSADSTA